MNNFVQRTLSGALFVSLIIASILLSKYYVFLGTFGIISGLTIREFHKLTNQQKDVSVNGLLGIGGAVLQFVTCYFFANKTLVFPFFLGYGIYIIMALILELYSKKTNPIHNWAYFLIGQILIAIPFSLLNFILFIDGLQPVILLALFATIWVNDTGAYLVGVTIGKHRLFERISPKKTWEGFFGGAIFTLISGYIFSLYLPQMNLLNWLIFSELIVIFGTYGDLLESLLKRTIDVKDSGNVIPGHGGLLDRFDSMLLAAPVIFIYLSILFFK